MHTLDAWRRRASQQTGVEKIVPVELVESCDSVRGRGSVQQRGQLRVVLSSGLRIEVEPGFDGAELRPLIAALEATASPVRMAPAV